MLEDGVHRRFQHPGESFGEIALLRGDPRTATVRTVEPTRLQALDRIHFITAVTGHLRGQRCRRRSRPGGRLSCREVETVGIEPTSAVS